MRQGIGFIKPAMTATTVIKFTKRLALISRNHSCGGFYHSTLTQWEDLMGARFQGAEHSLNRAYHLFLSS
jgi:hypothetical protein